MKNIILFGPPGAGKGTQADIIKNKYNLVHISTGEVFRTHLKNNTQLGILAKKYMDRGELVPDGLTINMLREVLEANKTDNGYIFDGFPRTESQAIAFDLMLEGKGFKIDKFVSLEVMDEILVKRLLERGKDSIREDDKDEDIVRNRIKEYYKKSIILKDFYKRQNKYEEINGIGNVDDITNSISHIIENIK